MKRSLWEGISSTTHESPIFPTECLFNIYKFVVEDGIVVAPKSLFLIHTINKEFLSKWEDRDYLHVLFQKASLSNEALFKRHKHGDYMKNYHKSRIISDAMPMINLLWKRIIDPIEITTETRNEFGRLYLCPQKPLHLCELVGHDGSCFLKRHFSEETKISDYDLQVIVFADKYMRMKYGWEILVGSGHDYSSDYRKYGANYSYHMESIGVRVLSPGNSIRVMVREEDANHYLQDFVQHHV